jgi:hypothetical protein
MVILDRMNELAKSIHNIPDDIAYLSKSMCVNALNNCNTTNKEYSNGSLSTLGDTVLKLI